MNHFSNARGWIAAALLAVVCMAPSQAQDKASMSQSCRSDFKALCPGVQPGGGRIAECLKQHVAELSPGCKSAMGQVSACGAEVKKVCGAQVASAAEVSQCVKSHASDFSEACRSDLQKQ